MTELDINYGGINKDRAKDFYIQAEIEFNQNNLEGARRALKTCSEYDPTYKEAYELACNIYLRWNKPEIVHNLLNEYSKILSSPTKEFFLLRAKAYLLQGGGSPTSEALMKAKDALDSCFAIKRDYDAALFVLADYNLHVNKTSEAIAIYERLHEKDKSNKDILFSLANAYFKQKEWDGAIIYCSKLLDARVDHPAVREIYKNSLVEKKAGLKEEKGRTMMQKFFAFIYDPETEKRLKIHSEQEWQLKRANQRGYLDEKTGILNFQALKDYFPALAQSTEENIYVGFLDINYFKFFNDYYGSHAVGDVVLKALGKVGTDLFPNWFFRRSGDEFIFVCVGDEKTALDKAEVFRDRAENQAMVYANEMIVYADPPLIDKNTQKPYVINRKITVSIGVALFKAEGRDLITVLEAAERNFKITHDGRKNAVVYKGAVVSSGEIPDKPVVGGR
jgi:diguanylate cyclase (GGDEF)-like protein